MESTLFESHNGIFCLTSRRVVYNSYPERKLPSLRQSSGSYRDSWIIRKLLDVIGQSGTYISISLCHVTSCKLITKNNPVLLALAAIFFVIYLMILSDMRDQVIDFYGTLIPFLLFISYFLTIKKVLMIESPTARIILDGKKKSNIDLIQTINMIESAQASFLSELKQART
jgi:hypothetical protein